MHLFKSVALHMKAGCRKVEGDGGAHIYFDLKFAEKMGDTST